MQAAFDIESEDKPQKTSDNIPSNELQHKLNGGDEEMFTLGNTAMLKLFKINFLLVVLKRGYIQGVSKKLFDV